MRKRALVIGHAYIVPANRKIWTDLSRDHEIDVSLIVPASWNSNLIGEINFETQKQDKSDNFRIFNIEVIGKGNGSFYFYRPWRLYKILSKNKYDFIVINQEGWSLSLFTFNLVNLFTKNRSSKLFLMIAQNIFKPKLWWSWPLEHFNMLFVDLVLGCCRETEAVLRNKRITTPWKYFPLFFNGNVVEKKSSPSKPITFGYIGRISEEKGINILLDAFKNYNATNDSKLLIAGDGPLNNKLDAPNVENLGLISHDKVDQFYEKVDILIVPSLTKKFWKEQFGRVIVEAISRGVYVIGSDSGAIPEVLGELKLSGIFKEGNVDSLEAAMLDAVRLIESDNYISHIESAQRLCEEKFSTRAFNRRLLEYVNG